MTVEHAQKVWSEWAEARAARVPYDLAWIAQYSWYGGDTSMFYGELPTGTPYVHRVTNNPKATNRRTRPINYTGHAADILVSKHMKSRPVFTSKPASSEQKDIQAARAARDWLLWWWEKERLAARRERLCIDRVVTGNAFVKVFFDNLYGADRKVFESCPTCGGLGVSPMPDPMMNPQLGLPLEPSPCPACGGTKQIQTGTEPMGEPRTCIVSPWEIYPSPGATEVETAAHVFHAYPISTAEAMARYGLGEKDVQPSSTLEEAESQFSKAARAARTKNLDENAVYVVEKHEPPDPGDKYPRITTLVGTKIVWPPEGSQEHEEGKGAKSETPYGRIPIFHFKLRRKPGDFFARGKIIDVISANDTVNRARHSIHRHIHKMAANKWLVERGSVSKDALNNDEGEVVEYEGVNAPKQSQAVPMPEYVQRALSDERDAVYAIMGISDIERGIVPPNVEAGSAFEILIEQSETSHGPVLVRDADEWASIGKAGLQCALANYRDDEERIVRVVGANGRHQARVLTKADIDGDVDIMVELGGAQDQNRALRRAMVLNYFTAGLIDAKKAMELAEFGAPVGDWDDEGELQESVACAENEAIITGRSHTMVAGLDDNAVHARLHRREALVQRLAERIDLAEALTQAAIEHEQALAATQSTAPPAAAGGGGDMPLPGAESQAPFDTGAAGMETSQETT